MNYDSEIRDLGRAFLKKLRENSRARLCAMMSIRPSSALWTFRLAGQTLTAVSHSEARKRIDDYYNKIMLEWVRKRRAA